METWLATAKQGDPRAPRSTDWIHDPDPPEVAERVACRPKILDENGIYDPNDSNDRLLLGFKETISEFELQGIRARLLGGQRSAAAHGALKLLLPIGLAYDESDEVVFDPDRSIVDAVRGVFGNFRRMRSALAVVRWMHEQNILLQSCPFASVKATTAAPPP